MPMIGLRQLSRETREVMDQLEQDGEPVVITRHGKPVATLSAVTPEQAPALALATVPEQVARREAAAESIAAGEGEPASQVLAELDAEDEEEAGLDEEMPVELPAAFFAEVGRAVAQDLEGAPEFTIPVSLRGPYFEYVRAVLRGSLLSGIERARAVNRNILEEATAQAEFSAEDFAEELKSAATVETLATRRREKA